MIKPELTCWDAQTLLIESASASLPLNTYDLCIRPMTLKDGQRFYQYYSHYLECCLVFKWPLPCAVSSLKFNIIYVRASLEQENYRISSN